MSSRREERCCLLAGIGNMVVIKDMRWGPLSISFQPYEVELIMVPGCHPSRHTFLYRMNSRVKVLVIFLVQCALMLSGPQRNSKSIWINGYVVSVLLIP